ncbi:hypothetical protein [Egicoccus halophilus]|uniref:hypothetical protein n=1 Tax=Egicoccus halophilus TaxID=1670830 RepID=UPI00102FE0FB|nr:hypothetical protein [Egicoccus halophilus]
MTGSFVVLVLLWAVLLVPGAVRRSRASSPLVTVGGFERAMTVLRDNRSTTRQLLVPGDADRIVGRDVDETDRSSGVDRPEDPVVATRRLWFLRALVASGVSLVLAVAFGGWLWFPTVLVVLGTAGYTVLLRQLKLQRDEARRVVAELDLHRPDEPTTPAAEVDEVWGVSGGVRLRRWEA